MNLVFQEGYFVLGGSTRFLLETSVSRFIRIEAVPHGECGELPDEKAPPILRRSGS